MANAGGSSLAKSGSSASVGTKSSLPPGVTTHDQGSGEDARTVVVRGGRTIGRVFESASGGWTSSITDRSGNVDFADHGSKSAAIRHVVAEA